MINASDSDLSRPMPASDAEAAPQEPRVRTDSVPEVMPTPTQPPDTHAKTLAYWLRRHEELKGDIRAVGNWDKSTEENQAGYERKTSKLMILLQNALGFIEGKRVLDLGCGTGLYACALGERGVGYTGVDISAVALDQARERYPEGSYIQADIAEFRPSEPFDAVLAVDILCYLTDDAAWRVAVDLIAKMVREGAIAIIVDRIKPERVAYQRHVLHRTIDEYRSAFAHHGLQFRQAPNEPGSYLILSSPTATESGELRYRTVTPADVNAVVEGYPNITFERGALIYSFIIKNGINTVLELGFNHGVSTCYMAAALASRGSGRIVTIDRTHTVAFSPGIEDFLRILGLHSLATVFYEHTTYNWRLREFLRLDPRPAFDMVFLDGAHTWEPDALAFLLAEKLLKPGGWFIFDDVNWSFANSTAGRESPAVQELPADERDLAPVREIIEILVRSHPHIAEWWDDNKWGFARKKTLDELNPSETTWKLIERRAVETRRHALARHPTKLDIPPDLSPMQWRDRVISLRQRK